MANLAVNALRDKRRVLLEADLAPMQGQRFQPTGFPDLGPATYTLPNGTEMLLVESVQSMANRLEGVGWDEACQEPVPALAGLPYVRVVDRRGAFLTSSRTESHRLASAFIKDGIARTTGQPMRDFLGDHLGVTTNRRIDWARIYSAVFALDPLALLHGVFFADEQWPGQPRIPRALSAFVEARGVRDVLSGGVKRDDVTHKTGEGQRAEEGYGHVPFPRREFVADQITAYFNLDLLQLRSFGLDGPAADLLTAVALWEVRNLLDDAMRLRTACDLKVTALRVSAPTGVADLPSADDLATDIGRLATRAADRLASPRVTEVVWNGTKAAKPKAQRSEDESQEDTP